MSRSHTGNSSVDCQSRFIELFGDPMTNPKGFPCYTVGEVIDFQGGSQPDKKYFEYESTPDNIRLIQIRDYKSDKYITYIPRAMAKRFCTADDIMVGRYGPPIFQILKGIEGSFNVALMKATPKMGNREFARQFLKQDCLLEYLEGLSKRTAGQDGIQMDKLKAYPFPYPPIELQEQFAAFVEQVDKSKYSSAASIQVYRQAANFETGVDDMSNFEFLSAIPIRPLCLRRHRGREGLCFCPCHVRGWLPKSAGTGS